jgi:hypothetical protein
MATAIAPPSKLIFRVQNDTGPDEQFDITRKDQPNFDFTGATAKLAIRSNTSGSITNSGHQTCTITSAEIGSMSAKYVFQSGDLPDAGGYYTCDLELTIGGKKETYYGYIKIRTRAEIAT